jgi:aminopeptidase N/puromycin-sensitive aminopeptidase
MRLLLSSLSSAALVGSFVVSSLLFATGAGAQRLPETVKPEHYELTLAPDLKTATFTGKETIDVLMLEPVDAITLNSAEIKFESVTTTLGGKLLTAKVNEDTDKQQVTLNFGEKLPAGKLKLEFKYTGILNNELRGFYLSKTAKRSYAVTQFESTDARRAFPSFDEPALKATFDVTLIVDKGDTAISNTNVISDKPMAGDKHAITFATTPKMSTYLVAFLVGDFKCLSGSSDGVPIRACATPDQVQYGAFALSAAEYVLHYYDTYFGIKYPMPKLDMIAIPDFEAGAMENFGAITYRESDMLLDSKHASVGAERNVGLVVAHEMAHQWFGDMVTLKWWDNTWLNEGFATWMENKPIEAWKPEWKMEQEVADDDQGTLNLDAQKITRTIRAKADTPDEINEMFDGISYGKAGAMLLMVENYEGKDTFRQGVHKYLSEHLYGNATAEDFWNTQAAVSHKPIDKIMDSLVSQPGEPLITIDDAEVGAVKVSQKRFFLNPKDSSNGAEVWTIPVCFKAIGGEHCELFSGANQSLAAPKAPLLFANAEGKGYYRTSYPEAVYRELVAHVESDLSPEERISLLGDQWALTRSGKANVESYLTLVAAVSGDSSATVLSGPVGSLSTIDRQIASTPEERSQFSAWVRAKFLPAYKSVGTPEVSDSPSKRELRAELLGIVAGLGHDPEAIAEAKAITARNLADPARVDQTLANAALNIAARNGDLALFEQLQKVSETAVNAQDRSDALRALALFRDPAIVKRALDYAVSGKVKNQDAVYFLAVELLSRDTQDQAWQYVQDNWDKVTAQFTTFGGAYLISGTGGFCSAEKEEQVSSFFAAHKVAASERTLERTKNQIQDCIDLRAAQEPGLKAWLAKQ